MTIIHIIVWVWRQPHFDNIIILACNKHYLIFCATMFLSVSAIKDFSVLSLLGIRLLEMRQSRTRQLVIVCKGGDSPSHSLCLVIRKKCCNRGKRETINCEENAEFPLPFVVDINHCQQNFFHFQLHWRNQIIRCMFYTCVIFCI